MLMVLDEHNKSIGEPLDPAEWINLNCKSSKYSFNYAHLNARSIPKHIDSLNLLISPSNIHVFGVCETFLWRGIPKASYHIPDFHIIRNDRTSRGGGVAMYVKTNIKHKIIEKSPPASTVEYILVELIICGSNILVGVFYNPPPVASTSLEKLHEVFAEIVTNYDNVVVMGDFNINLLDDPPSYIVTKFRSLLASLCLKAVPYTATRGNSLLDLIIVPEPNFNKINSFAQRQVPHIADHDLLIASYNHRSPKPLNCFVNRPCFEQIDYNILSHNIELINWDWMYTTPLIDEQIKFLNESIMLLYNLVPTKRTLLKDPKTPWMNTFLLHLIKERELARRVYRQSKSEEDLATYKTIRNTVVTEIRRAKRDMYHNLFANSSVQDKWKNIRKLGMREEKVKNSVSLDADLLNKHFTTTPENKATLSIAQVKDSDSIVGFSFVAVTEMEVYKAIYSLKSNAAGIDGIPLKFVKIILPYILPYVTHTFNHCITTSSFPSLWKSSLVVPIPKKPDATEYTDFRGISLLPVLSKAFEVLIKSQIETHVKANKLMSNVQSGFRKYHSTTTALCKINYDILQNMNASQFTLLCLLDFSKAFDSLHHTRLLQKLRTRYQFSSCGINLLHSYLSDRQQAVKSDDQISSFSSLSSGVPQGSVLGPLLFSMYIDDISTAIKHSNYHLYADDCQVYMAGCVSDISLSFNLYQNDLNNISFWASSNGLTLNAKKTQLLSIYKRKLDIELPILQLNGENLKFSDSARNLGVIFNNTLTWNDHIDYLCSKVYGSLRSLRYLKEYTPVDMRAFLVQFLVIPLFTYCDILFYNPDFESARRLNVAFNACTRYVFGLRKFDHVSAYKKNILGCSFQSFLKYRVCVFLHKVIHTKHPSYLFTLLTFGTSQRVKRLQSLSSRFSSYQFGKSMFTNGICLWNSLPEAVKVAGTISDFKTLCFKYFCDND